MASYHPVSSPASVDHHQLPLGVVLRRFALFMDGMGRAMFVPFGPELVYRIMHDHAEVTPRTWSSIAFRVALTMAIFLVGHSAGPIAADKVQMFWDPQSLHVIVARLGGVAIALHLFSWGAGISHIFFLILIRFLYALLAGMLRAITDSSALPEESPINSPSSLDSPTKQQQQQQPTSMHGFDFAPATAKIYMTGFGVSTVTGGVFFHAVSTSKLFQTLTGTYIWSILFIVAVTVIGEISLRTAFALTTQPEHLDRSSGTARNVRRIVRRIVGGKALNPRVSFKVQDDDDPETERLLVTSPDDLSRQRAASVASYATDASEYFDCNSDISEDPEEGGISLVGKSTILEDDIHSEIARYADRKCCYADGTPAYVPPGDRTTIVPANYLEDCGGDRNRAMKMWQETHKWRRERNVWKIHTTPNTFYYDIRKAYPHCAHGYSKEGLAVMYEQPGKMNLRALFQGDCTIDDMVHHYIFLQEYLSNCLCASDELRKKAGLDKVPYDSSGYGIIVVMDIEGAGISMLSTDVIKYLTTVSAINQAYYPRSMKRVCVVNCPFWASGVFQTIKKILPASVKADLFSNNCVEGLRQYIDDDQIPQEYGGSSPYKFGEHPFATNFSKLVDLAAQVDPEANDTPKVVSLTPKEVANEKQKHTPETGTRQHEIAATFSDRSDADHSVRRRAVSPIPPSNEAVAISEPEEKEEEDKEVVGVDSLAFVSFFCAFWSGVQGAIEVAIPLWLSSPVRFGGLGYSPSTSGVALFSVFLVLLFLLSTNRADGLISQSRIDPLRALRRGLGGEALILFLLALTPINLSANDQSNMVFLAATSFLAMGALASMVGRSGAMFLGLIVSDGLSQHLSKSPERSSASVFSAEYLIAECTSGQAANFLSLIAEVVGVLVNSQIWMLSIDRDRPSKYDGTVFLYVPALIAGCLYFLSHFLRIKPTEKVLAPSLARGDIENGRNSPRKAE